MYINVPDNQTDCIYLRDLKVVAEYVNDQTNPIRLREAFLAAILDSVNPTEDTKRVLIAYEKLEQARKESYETLTRGIRYPM